NTIGSAFENAILEGEKLSDVLKALGRDLLRLAIRRAAIEPFSNALGGIFGSIGARVAHAGAIAGQTNTEHRRVAPAVFANAPRYHSGTMGAGLKPDEVPAILRRGEPVFKSMDHARQVVGGGRNNNFVQQVIVNPPAGTETRE